MVTPMVVLGTFQFRGGGDKNERTYNINFISKNSKYKHDGDDDDDDLPVDVTSSAASGKASADQIAANATTANT